METTVGRLRQQTALCDGKRRVVIVSDEDSLKGLQIVSFYPDTTDEDGNWNPTFKIKIESRINKRQTLYFTSSGPPFVVVCETDEHAQATRRRAKEWSNQEVSEAAYQEALAKWNREWERMRNVEKEG